MLAGLHDLFEFASEGLTVTDTIDDEHDGYDEYVAFRTMVQPDGDMCVSIHPRALDRPDFVERHTKHIDHVSSELDARLRRLRHMTIAIDRVGPVGALVLVVTTSWNSGVLEELLSGVVMSYVQFAGISVAAVLLRPLSLWLLRSGIAGRRMDRARERIADAIARLTRLD